MNSVTHHSRYIQLVVFKHGPIPHLYSYSGQRHRGTEVEERSDAVVHKVLTGEKEVREEETAGAVLAL